MSFVTWHYIILPHQIWNHPDILADLLTVRDSMADDLDADLDLPEIQAK